MKFGPGISLDFRKSIDDNAKNRGMSTIKYEE
jgi:hypothetical protein